jgi:sugar phosphate isomerase/epimerase
LFSVSYAGLWGQHQFDLRSFLKKAAALGYPAVELMGRRPHLSPPDVDDNMADEIRRTAEQASIEIATIAGYTNFTLGRDTEVPSVEIQIAYVRRLAQLAQKLGAKIVRLFTG